jgi:hypothetical protein
VRFPEPTAPDLARWCRDELAALTAPETPGEDGPVRPLSYAAVLADDAAVLRSAHRRLTGLDVTPQAAATYISGWFNGGVGRLVSLGLATAGAGLLLDPRELVFDVVEDRWPEQIHPGRVRAVVAPGHRWAGGPGVEVVDVDEVLPRTMTALVEVLTPLVEACRGLARVSRVGLWDQVADGLVCDLAQREGMHVTPLAEEVALAAVAIAGMPWKARPRLVWAHSEVLGRMLVAQKGGCCLAFTNKREPTPESELSPALLAYRQRFGIDRPGKRYCTTCPFRDTAEVVERRVAWAEIRHRHEAQLAGAT